MSVAVSEVRANRIGDRLAGVELSASSGSVPSTDASDVFHPRDEWIEEGSAFEECPALDFRGSVTAFEVGTDLAERFRSQLPTLLDPLGSSEQRSAALANFGELVAERIAKHGVGMSEVRGSNVAINAPGTRSTGRDFQTGQRVGLHIDNHDRLPLNARSTAIQLLAMNCGSADRYFVYVDLPVVELARRVGTRLDDVAEDPRRASDELKTEFLRLYPTYPVRRLRIPSGYAYIATPQDLIHDGAGASELAPDIAFLMLGRFHFHRNA